MTRLSYERRATYTFSLRAKDAYGTQIRAREADDTIVIDQEDSLDTQTGRERDILRRAERGDYSSSWCCPR